MFLPYVIVLFGVFAGSTSVIFLKLSQTDPVLLSAYRLLVAPLLNYMRTWDVASSARVDRYVANSSFVARRIRKYYRRRSTVIHPPVDTNFFDIDGDPGDYYLMVAAMVPYKGLDLAIDAFNSIIVSPQVGVLAIGSVRRTPVAIGNAVEVRQMMSATLSTDHRAAGGAEAAQFANEVQRRLEDPKLLET